MIDNQTSLFHSHTSKTSTNQNMQQSSSNNHHTQYSNQQQPVIRRREFAEPKPKSAIKQSHQVMEGTFVQKSSGKGTGHHINTDSIDKHSAQGIKVSHSIQSQNEKLLAAALDNNVLDYSPFNFLQGINPRRLQKGRSLLGRSSLIDALKCTFCNSIIVQGQECDHCEGNFCSPCIKQWQASDSAKIYSTPCKCGDNASLKQLNKLKQEYLNQIRFKCNNQRCTYQLTYDELLLGTHELDDCNFMTIVCEGCGMRIFKQDQIRHESIECSNPIGKCNFCNRIFGMSELLVHRRECSQRTHVKVEYVHNPEAGAMNTTFNQSKFPLMEYDQRPDQEYRPSGNSSGSKSNNRQKSSNESKALNQQSPEKPSSKETKKSGKSGRKGSKRASQRQTVVEDVFEKQVCKVSTKHDVVAAQEVTHFIPINDAGKALQQHPQQSRRSTRGLGLISHTDNMSQAHNQQESLPPATQSTSRKENNTTTGIVYTQSSAAHPIQSQTLENRSEMFAKAKSSKNNYIVIDDENSSESEKYKGQTFSQKGHNQFSSQPVGTQPLEVVNKGAQKPLPNTDIKQKLKRRSRSRGGLCQEELFREALADKKEKELIRHQTNFVEHSSGVHLSELERSVQHKQQPQPAVTQSKVTNIFASGKKQTTLTGKTSRSQSRHKNGHHRATGSMSHLNPRKISVQSKRLTRQQAKNAKPSRNQESHYEQEQASSCLEYDLESREMVEKAQPIRTKEIEQILAASSSSNILQQKSKNVNENDNDNENENEEENEEVVMDPEMGSETDSEDDMIQDDNEDESDELIEEEEASDQQEPISETSQSMIVQTACQNVVPQSSIVSHGMFKPSHSAMNQAGTVRQFFQGGAAIKKANKLRQQMHQRTEKPARGEVHMTKKQQTSAQAAVVNAENTRRSSRHVRSISGRSETAQQFQRQ